MKVLGQFMGGCNSMKFAVGGYVVFEAQWVNTETYRGGVSVEDERRCFLSLGTAYLITQIKHNNGEYMDPETAKAIVRDIATKDVVDLDKYNMAFFGIWDIRPDSIAICNELDEECNPIPLEVVSV